MNDNDVITAMRRWGGGFAKALAEAASRADSDNLRRIKDGWPEYWRRYAELAKAEQQKESNETAK